MNEDILAKLYEVLQQRKESDAEASYVASLYDGGSAKIAEKILEEAQEFIDEAFMLDNAPEDGMNRRNMREEAADLLFHSLVMLAHHDMEPKEVLEVLERRFGLSGHEEKANRSS